MDAALLVPLLYTAPINLIACSALFLGDGLADPIGRLLGRSSDLYTLNPSTPKPSGLSPKPSTQTPNPKPCFLIPKPYTQ